MVMQGSRKIESYHITLTGKNRFLLTGLAVGFLVVNGKNMTTKQLHNSFTRRTLLTWSSIVLLILVACPAKTVEPAHIRYNANAPSEYELKAIYLYNFLQFFKWPGNSCDLHEGRSHQIAVLGDSSFNETLQALQKKLQEKDKELKLTLSLMGIREFITKPIVINTFARTLREVLEKR